MTKKTFWIVALAFVLMVPVLAEAQTHTFTLNWVFGAVAADKHDAPTGVKVERKLGMAGAFAEIAKLGLVTSYQDALPNPAPGGAQYCYRVRAFNSVGDGPYSSEGCGTTAVIVVPTVPNAVTGFSVSALTSTVIELSWALGDAGDNYKLERRKGNQPKIVEKTGTLLAGVTSYRDEILRKGTTYCYDMIAYNIAGNSAPTPVLCATTRR